MQSCPKKFINGPCGGYRGRECEVGGRECVFIKAYSRLSNNELRRIYSSVALDSRFKVRNYIPVPPRRPNTEFMKALSGGNELIIYEVFLKVSRDINEVVNSLVGLSNSLVLAVTDSPLGTLTYDPLTLSLKLLNELRPYDIIMNLAVRNKTIDDIIMKVVTASKLGIRNYLIVSGDWNFKGVSTPYYDVDTTEGIYLVRLALDLGIDCRGKIITTPLPGHVGAVANQYSPYTSIEVLRNLRKELAGAEYLILQPNYSMDVLRRFINELRNHGFTGYVIPSYAPILNRRHLKLLSSLGIEEVDKELLKAVNTSLSNAFKVNTEYILSMIESVGTKVIYVSTYGDLVIAKEFLSTLVGALRKLGRA